MNTARQYCEMVRELMVNNPNAVGFYDFILANGKEFHSKPLPSKLPSGINLREYKLKECYYNAQMVALLHDLDYYEGFATSFFPTEHAWAVHGEELIDLTWDKVAKNGEEYDYFGVHIPSDFIAKSIVRTKLSVPMLLPWIENTGKDKVRE